MTSKLKTNSEDVRISDCDETLQSEFSNIAANALMSLSKRQDARQSQIFYTPNKSVFPSSGGRLAINSTEGLSTTNSRNFLITSITPVKSHSIAADSPKMSNYYSRDTPPHSSESSPEHPNVPSNEVIYSTYKITADPLNKKRSAVTNVSKRFIPQSRIKSAPLRPTDRPNRIIISRSQATPTVARRILTCSPPTGGVVRPINIISPVGAAIRGQTSAVNNTRNSSTNRVANFRKITLDVGGNKSIKPGTVQSEFSFSSALPTSSITRVVNRRPTVINRNSRSRSVNEDDDSDSMRWTPNSTSRCSSTDSSPDRSKSSVDSREYSPLELDAGLALMTLKRGLY